MGHQPISYLATAKCQCDWEMYSKLGHKDKELEFWWIASIPTNLELIVWKELSAFTWDLLVLPWQFRTDKKPLEFSGGTLYIWFNFPIDLQMTGFYPSLFPSPLFYPRCLPPCELGLFCLLYILWARRKPVACFSMAFEVRMAFIFLNSWKKSKEE